MGEKVITPSSFLLNLFFVCIKCVQGDPNMGQSRPSRGSQAETHLGH
jgi:hypothetical protein